MWPFAVQFYKWVHSDVSKKINLRNLHFIKEVFKLYIYIYIYIYIYTHTHTHMQDIFQAWIHLKENFLPLPLFLLFISFLAYFLLEHHAPLFSLLNLLFHMNVCSLKGNQPLEALIMVVTVPISRTSIMPSWFLSALQVVRIFVKSK